MDRLILADYGPFVSRSFEEKALSRIPQYQQNTDTTRRAVKLS